MTESAIGICSKCGVKSYLFRTVIGDLCRFCKVKIFGNCCSDDIRNARPVVIQFRRSVRQRHEIQ